MNKRLLWIFASELLHSLTSLEAAFRLVEQNLQWEINQMGGGPPGKSMHERKLEVCHTVEQNLQGLTQACAKLSQLIREIEEIEDSDG